MYIFVVCKLCSYVQNTPYSYVSTIFFFFFFGFWFARNILIFFSLACIWFILIDNIIFQQSVSSLARGFLVRYVHMYMYVHVHTYVLVLYKLHANNNTSTHPIYHLKILLFDWKISNHSKIILTKTWIDLITT